MGFMSQNSKKDLNFELNLIPIIDIMSVCICFLLMTVVWVHIGSMNASQALGGQSQKDAKKTPMVWVYLKEGNRVVFSFRDTAQKLKDMSVSGNQMERTLEYISQRNPEVKTAVIMPHKKSPYSEIISLMDGFKKRGINDIGVSPL